MAKTQIPAGYIAANAITATEIATNSITAAAIASDAIVVADIADNSITSAKIAADAVGSSEIATLTADLSFGDNVKAIFGAGSDLQIYHDGNHSVINESGTGHLKIQGNEVRLQNVSGTENMLTAVNDGAVNLFYNDNLKLSTTNTGIDVTGTVVADGLTSEIASSGARATLATFTNTASLAAGAQSTIQLKNGGQSAFITGESTAANAGMDILFSSNNSSSSEISRMRLAENGDISFYEDTGTTAKLFWDASIETLTLSGTSAGGLTLDRGTSGNQLKFANSGTTQGYFGYTNGTGFTFAGSDGGADVVIDSTGNVGIGTTSPSTILGGNSLEISNATGSEVIVFRDDGSAVAGDFCGGFVIGNKDASGTPNHYAGMWADTDAFGQMTLQFAGGRDKYEAGTADMVIDVSGNVGIGTASPSAALDVTGNIAVSGTVDGRDLATDGTKLDGIEANATADQTASEILTALLTVDGAGSGLDADTLDGISSASFLRSDADDTLSGNLTVTGNLTVQGTTVTLDATTLNVEDKNITINYSTGDSSGSADGAGITIQDAVNSTTDATILWNATNDEFDFSHGISLGDSSKVTLGTSGDLEIYHDGNNSFIDEVGTGDLYIRATSKIELKTHNGAETYAQFNANGAAKLYYDSSSKLATTSTGIDVTGNITLSGTVDGRDIASDGSKLDGIESGATADQTAAEILTAIKTVDGAGSGLDADLLDGLSSASFVRSDASDSISGALSISQGTLATPTLSVTNSGGTSSAVIAKFIGDSDGIEIINSGVGDYQIRNTQQNNGITLYDGTGGVALLYNGTLTAGVDSGGGFSVYTGGLTVDSGNINIVSGNLTLSGTVDGRDIASDGSKLDGIESGATADQSASEILTLIKTVDGAGSGLDADLLDGISSGSFLRSDANDTYSGTITFQAPTNGTGVFMTKAVDSPDEPAILVLAGDADSEDDLAFEIRGNGTGSSVDLSTTMSSSDTKFAIFQSGHTTIGYNSLGTSYTPVNAYGLNVNGTISSVNGYYAGSTQVINSSGNWVGGTVDGRDVSADGSKLDGIESGATADQTAAEILTAIKTVDGAGSGLDADTLDGQQGSYYQPASTAVTLSGTQTITGTKTFDGSSSSPFRLHLSNASNSWDAITFQSTTEWGDTTQYGVLGGDSSEGLMLRRPHVVWNSSAGSADIRLGRSGGVSSGKWVNMGVKASSVGFLGMEDTNVLTWDTSHNVNIPNGNLGVGTTSTPSHLLHVASTGDASIMIEADTDNVDESHNPTLLWSQDGGLVTAQMGIDNGNNMYLKANYSSSDMFFMTNGSERMRILSSGGLTFNGDTASANALDDYEEGTWTPQNNGGTTGGATNITGRYTKIGRMVYATMQFNTSAGVDTGLNYRVISNLPYAMYANSPVGQLGNCSMYNLDAYRSGYVLNNSSSNNTQMFVAWNQTTSTGSLLRALLVYETA